MRDDFRLPLWVQSILIRSQWLQAIYYRFRCPGGGRWVKDCIAAGDCGCDNNRTG